MGLRCTLVTEIKDWLLDGMEGRRGKEGPRLASGFLSLRTDTSRLNTGIGVNGKENRKWRKKGCVWAIFEMSLSSPSGNIKYAVRYVNFSLGQSRAGDKDFGRQPVDSIRSRGTRQ